MNEISKSTNINSIEEFRACYEQELKEMLEELNKKGVTNIEGVEEVIKLFFDEYYQYLSVELASRIETIVANQQSIYELREKQQLLEFFKDENNGKSIAMLKGALSEKSVGRKLKDYGYHWFELGIDTLYENGRRAEKSYLSKNYPRLFSLLETNVQKISVGSIMYNGQLKQFEKLLSERDTIKNNIDEYKEQIKRIETQMADSLETIPLTNLSYSLPSDLFDGFNQELFKFMCDKVYLNNHNMVIRIWDTYAPPVEKAEEDRCLGSLTKITDEVLREFLKEPISFGSFWREGIIDDFLKRISEWLESFEKYNYFLMDKNAYSLNVTSKYRDKWLMWKKIYNILSSPWFYCPTLLLGLAFGGGLGLFLSGILNIIILAVIAKNKVNPNKELFKEEFKELLKQEISKMKKAHEKLVANRKNYLQEFQKELFSESFSKLAEINANIEKLEKDYRQKGNEIMLLSGGVLSPEIVSYKMQGDNSELHAYILKRLIDKYKPRIEPMINEYSRLREDIILDNYDIDHVPYCAVATTYDDKIPVIGPTITRKLEDKKN